MSLTGTLSRYILIAVFLISAAVAAEEDEPLVVEKRPFVGDFGWHDSLAYRLLLLPQSLLDTVLHPLERFVIFSEKVHLPTRLRDFFSNEDHTIFYYPSFMYSTDDGLAIGANYENEHFLRREHQLELHGMLYANSDNEIEFSYESPAHEYRRTFFLFEVERESNSTARFYGIGNDTVEEDKSIFHEIETSVLLDIGMHSPFTSSLAVHGIFGYLNTDTADGNPGNSRPKILEFFDRSELPGFGRTVEFASAGLGFTYDTRNKEKHPWKGSLIAADWTHYFPLSEFSEQFEHDLFHFSAVKLIPLATPRRVVALGIEHRSVESSERGLPFQLLPRLGDNTRLRGYSSGRFRDRRTLVTNLEYRYHIWDTLLPHAFYGLGTLFLDGGQVFDRWSEVDPSEFHWGGGFGFVFGYRDRIMLRLQLAYGREGLNTSVGVSHAF